MTLQRILANLHEDQERTAGRLPVAEHLRPARAEGETDCPLYVRLVVPADRGRWRRYELADFLPLAVGAAMPIAGEA